ncbi:sialidase family protein, partial [Janthinobacterium sp.]|uniref:sialidase family protein n=1 Tax=Janthinobacterium sp. TaxID=1871054 RepID=UPI0025BBB62A
MGTKRDPKGDRRGILLPLPEIKNATITTTGNFVSGPIPGGAVPERTTRMQLVTSGTLDGELDQIRIATAREGGVGDATIRWQYTTGSLCSWDPPVMISGFEFVDRSTTANKYTRPHAIRVPSTGRSVVVVVQDLNVVQVWTQGGTGLWTSVTVEDTGDDTAACLCALPSGRLVCLYIAPATTGGSTSQIRAAYSDDNGATWTVSASDCLETPLSKATDKYKRIRAAHLNGAISVLLWESDATDTIYQYVSTTEGSTLTAVETFSIANKACPDLVSARGFLHVLTVEYETLTGSDYVGRYRRLSSATQPLSSAAVVPTQAAVAGNTMEWGSYAAGVFTAAEAALIVDDDGDLWAYSCDHAAGHEVFVRHSTDGGDTWAQNGASSHTAKGTLPFWSGASTDRLKDIAVAPERGRAVLFSRSAAGAATADDSLLATYLGGWSTVGFPQDTTAARRAGVAGWDVPWLPIEKPQDLGAIWSANGAGTDTLGASGLTVTTVANTRYYETTPTLTSPAADGLLWEGHVSAGAAT